MREWLENSARRLAAGVGEDASAYALSDEHVGKLLDLARVAAHDSGDRTNAPLACYLVGLAGGRHPERALSELVDPLLGEQPG